MYISLEPRMHKHIVLIRGTRWLFSDLVLKSIQLKNCYTYVYEWDFTCWLGMQGWDTLLHAHFKNFYGADTYNPRHQVVSHQMA